MEKLVFVFVLNFDHRFFASPLLDFKWKLLQVLLDEWIVELHADESLGAIDGVL